MIDALAKSRKQPGEGADDELALAVDGAEVVLDRDFSMYPSDPDILEADAKLKRTVGDLGASTQLLERAWRKMPRGSGVARTLAQ